MIDTIRLIVFAMFDKIGCKNVNFVQQCQGNLQIKPSSDKRNTNEAMSMRFKYSYCFK